jgi:hypothetical protein
MPMCMQVDTHIHHSSSMNQKHLLRFIKKKLRMMPHEIVAKKDGKDLSLAQVLRPSASPIDTSTHLLAPLLRANSSIVRTHH